MFISERGKIRSRYVTGLTVQQQRQVATAIKNAREMALLPYRRRGRTLTSSRRGTDRPFTVIVCTACAADHDLSVIDELRPTIRRCPHAMLVSAACMLGPLTCASRPTGMRRHGIGAALHQ